MNEELRNKTNIIANVKAFAIFFVALMVIDIVLFIVSKGNVSRNYVTLAGILQFLYIRFGKKGLIAVEIIIALILFCTIFEVLIFKTYGVFMSFSSAINNAKNITENYSDELLRVVANNMTFIIRFIIFYAVVIVTSDEYLVKKQEIVIFNNYDNLHKKINYAVLIASVVVFVISIIAVDKSNDFSSNVQRNGVKSAFVTNLFKAKESIVVDKKTDTVIKNNNELLDKYNVFDIDYLNLDETGVDERCRNVNEYVASRQPSNKNEYTGIFKGKNLILICAEAYSHYVINEELTPTLYRLTNNGFRFNDFYVPSWGGSTISGEFAFLNGLIPNDGANCMKNAIGKNMCFTMPRVLKREGYDTGAYHNGNFKYYDRNLTHRYNLGFDYYIANGNGLEDIAGEWSTDEAMLEKTFESYHCR